MKHNDVVVAVTRILDDAGIAYGMHQGWKHPAACLRPWREDVKLWLPASPSDVRSVRSARAFTRRLLRKLGLS